MSDGILTKIRALLDKAESTTFEPERDAYLEKANALMVKHAVDEWAVSNRGDAPRLKPEARMMSVPPDKAGQALVGAVCRVTGVKAVFIKPYGFRGEKPRIKEASLVGFKDDLDLTEMLYTSLLLQMETSKVRALKTKPVYEHGKAFANSFKWGFVDAVSSRLREFHQKAVDETVGSALVLRDKSSLVQEEYDRLHPNVRKAPRVSTGNSWAGQAAGSAAGQKADVSGGRRNVGGGRGKALSA